MFKMSAGKPSATIRRRIEFSDVDPSGRYHYGTVIRLLEAAEVEFLAQLGLIDELYTSMPRARFEADYLSPLYFRDEVEVTVEVVRLGRTSVTFGFRVERRGKDPAGELCARGTLVAVLVDGDGNSTPWPDEVREKLDPDAGQVVDSD